MPRLNTGTFPQFQSISLPGMAAMTLPEAVEAALADIEAGAEFAGSWLDEIGSLINTTLTDRDYRPNGDHFGGRNMESELLAGRDAVIAIRDSDEQTTDMRVGVVPQIAKLEEQIQRRDFLKTVRDPDWGADIMELVLRIAPHGIQIRDAETGLYVVQQVSIKLESLVAEVDNYGEICCWMYEESS